MSAVVTATFRGDLEALRRDDILTKVPVDEQVGSRIHVLGELAVQFAASLNPELEHRYRANRLTVMRQVPYEPGSTKTLDLALFVAPPRHDTHESEIAS